MGTHIKTTLIPRDNSICIRDIKSLQWECEAVSVCKTLQTRERERESERNRSWSWVDWRTSYVPDVFFELLLTKMTSCLVVVCYTVACSGIQWKADREVSRWHWWRHDDHHCYNIMILRWLKLCEIATIAWLHHAEKHSCRFMFTRDCDSLAYKDAARWTRTVDLQKLNPTSKTGSEIN